MREREKTRKDDKIAAAAASMGNRGTQLSDYVSDRKKAQSNKVFNVTGLTGALKGEKEGDLGINLDNSEYVTTTSERNAQKIDHYFENKKAEKLRLAELEAQKKRIAETPENGDNDEGGVLAVPNEQVDESHVAAQQSDASESQDPHVVAEQTQTSEQVDESHVDARQFGAAEKTDAYEEKSLSREEELGQKPHKPQSKYRRSMAKRRKFLLSLLDKNEINNDAEKFIKTHDGRRVPPGYEVSHIKPLYSASTIEEMKILDDVDNMELVERDRHREMHKICGDTYHQYGPSNKPHYK